MDTPSFAHTASSLDRAGFRRVESTNRHFDRSIDWTVSHAHDRVDQTLRAG
jgi:hypothetical protein